MDELFFGAKKKKKSSPRKTKRSPKRVPKRSPKRSPKRVPKRSPKRSPRRRTTMCSKKMSLNKLRRLAMQSGISIYSNAKVSVSKRTGLPKKPKKVGCATLKKRLNNAGLDYLYKSNPVLTQPMMDPMAPMGPMAPMDPVDPMDPMAPMDPMEPEPMNNDEMENLFEEMGPLPITGPCTFDQLYRGGSCMNIADITEDRCTGDEIEWNKKDKKCGRKSTVKKMTPADFVYLTQADPACDSEFKKLAKYMPNPGKFLKEYKGYAMGQGRCDQRELLPRIVKGDEDELTNYADVAEFDMSYGKRYPSSRRPKSTFKHVGDIVVKGRKHHVYRGLNGGLFYLKGKKGDKIYVDKQRLKKKSPKRK